MGLGKQVRRRVDEADRGDDEGMIEAARGEGERLRHTPHDLDAARGGEREHSRRGIDTKADAQGCREAPAPYADLDADARPRQEGPQGEQFRDVGRRMVVEPGLVTAGMGIKGGGP